MKIMLPFAAFAAIASAPVWADCVVPNEAVQIPDGAVATKDEMIAAQKQVVAFDAAVKSYSDCLQQEQADKIAGGADKAKTEKQYAKLNNTQVEKVQALADKFNAELKAYKAKTTG